MRAHLRLLPFVAVVALLLAACQGGNSPTEPSFTAAKSVAASTTVADGSAVADESGSASDQGLVGRRLAARAAAEGAASGTSPQGAPAAAEEQTTRAVAEGNGNGHGNGGGGNGGGNGGGHGGGHGNHGGATLRLEMQPSTWNTNFANAGGTVSALVRGDISKVDTASVKLVGDGGTATPTRVQTAGGQLRAFFAMSDAIAVLDHPVRGETREVKLQLTVDGTATELTTHVRIVGPAGGDDPGDEGQMTVAVQPDTWNTNWSHANGTVSILLRGDVADIDLASIKLVGDAGIEVSPTSVKRTGHQVRARFPMDDAFASLDDPDPGETHELVVKVLNGATAKELTVTVRIVGPSTD